MKIIWRDAHSQSDWVLLEDAKKFGEKSWNKPNITYGKIIEETKKYIIVASSMNTAGELFGDILMIPKSLIIKRKK